MVKSSRAGGESVKSPTRLEAQLDGDDNDPIAFPRMIVRIWGLISSISYIASGINKIVHGETQNCKKTGIYMLVIGLLMFGFECPCILIIMKSTKTCPVIDQKIPFWVKGVFYLGIVVEPLALCFSLKTMLTSLTAIILALLYFFLTCLQGNARYKRLQTSINAHFAQGRTTATVSYNTISHAHATISAFKNASKKQHHSPASKSSKKYTSIPRTKIK